MAPSSHQRYNITAYRHALYLSCSLRSKEAHYNVCRDWKNAIIGLIFCPKRLDFLSGGSRCLFLSTTVRSATRTSRPWSSVTKRSLALYAREAILIGFCLPSAIRAAASSQVQRALRAAPAALPVAVPVVVHNRVPRMEIRECRKGEVPWRSGKSG